MIVAQRLRKGSCGSARGAARLVADALKTVHRLADRTPPAGAGACRLGVLRPRHGRSPRSAAGADVSVTVRLDPKVKAAIAAIGDDAWTPIEYTDAVFDEQTETWISRAEVAEIPFTAFTSSKKTEQVPGRLVVRRIPDLNPASNRTGRTPCSTPGGSTPSSPPPTPPGRHRGRGQDPPRTRDHRAGPRRPEELRPGAPALGKFTANAAWLVLAVIAFNLTRAAATLAGAATGQGDHRARSAAS